MYKDLNIKARNKVAVELKKALHKKGYDLDDGDLYESAQYILFTREYPGHENYSVEDWIKDTEDNYPEVLGIKLF